VQAVDAASELSQFLTSRRAKVTPEQVGLPTFGQRRVRGLRREEVASLAGVRVEYLAANQLGRASTPRSSRPASSRPTAHASPSSTPVLRSSSSTGRRPPRTLWQLCARWRAATRTTVRCRSSSASCRPAATRFAHGGQRTTCAITRPEPSGCIIPSSATSSSATRSWSSQPIRDYGWRSSPPNPAAAPTRPESCCPSTNSEGG
jgi:hypothetical protein